MMMRMLDCGGLDVMTDSVRRPDEDNPRGYYELECVKKLAEETAWLSGARGRVVKIVSSLLKFLPVEYDYAIVFLRRDIKEVLASQREMLGRRGETSAVSDERLGELFAKHLAGTEHWIDDQPNMRVLSMEYGEVLEAPARASAQLDGFLGGGLKTTEMAKVVDPCLYRQKR